jgi:hypothetical protein
MTANLIFVIGFLGLTLITAAAVYFWRRSTGLYSLLVEGANRYEELRNRSEKMQEAGLKLEGQLKRAQRAKSNLEAGIDDARSKSSELTQKLEIKDHEISIITNKIQLERTSIDQELAQGRAFTEANQAKFDALFAQSEALKISNNIRIEELESELAAATKAAKEMETKLETVDASIVKAAKRKANHLERLYNSMKGLKEMSDERNANWEKGIRLLSRWIVTNHSAKDKDIPLAIGPLLAKALQITGNQLIDDSEAEESVVRSSGATRAMNMEAEISVEEAKAEETESASIAADKLEAEKTE